MNSNITTDEAAVFTRAGSGSIPSSPRRAKRFAVLDLVALFSISGGAVAAAQILGPTTPAGNSAAALGLFGALVLVLGIRWRRREPWATLGLVRPDSWWRTLLVVALATVVLYVVGLFALKILLPILGGAAPDVSRFTLLRGNLGMLAGLLVSVWITAAFIEEVVFRGFLMGRLAVVFGGGRGAWLASLGASAVIFGLLHAYQGLPGIVITGLLGLLLGALYLLARRILWVVILAHGLVDTISLVLIYLGVDI